jgi:hypothetical protein
MFNSELKKEWLTRLENIQQEYISEMSQAQESTIGLFETRKDAVMLIKQVEGLINTIANTPKKYSVKLEQVNVKLKEFRNIISLQNEGEIAAKISGSVAGVGALAGAGVAALGPTAAMAIATTFGTASTGTAIASLSGAAATNAALAWLGGGALVAGGGGVSAGSAFLALAGPVGWAIGGLALLGGGIFASSKNKKIAEEAEHNVYKIKEQINFIIKTRAEIVSTQRLTEEHSASLTQELYRVEELVRASKPKMSLLDRIKYFLMRLINKEVAVVSTKDKISYSDFNSDLKKELGSLVNNTLSLTSLIEKKIG